MSESPLPANFTPLIDETARLLVERADLYRARKCGVIHLIGAIETLIEVVWAESGNDIAPRREPEDKERLLRATTTEPETVADPRAGDRAGSAATLRDEIIAALHDSSAHTQHRLLLYHVRDLLETGGLK